MNCRILILIAVFTGELTSQTPAQQAREALSKGDYARAEQLYRALVREAPASAELLSNLGMALHLEGNSSEAIQILERAVAAKELAPALAILALNYCKLRQNDRAAEVLRRARRYASDMDVMNELGPCYLEAGDPMDAVLVYQDLVDRAIAPADENEAGLAKAYFRASKYYLDQLEKAPQNGAYIEAIEQARKESSPNARGAFAIAFQSAPYVRTDMSFADLGGLLGQHPNDAALLYLVGVLAGERAMQAFQDCEKRFANSAALRRLYASMLRSQRKFEAAAEEYRALHDFADLADLFRENGDWEKALESYRALAAEHPKDESAVAGASEALLRLSRFEEAERELQPILKRPHAPEWAFLDASKAEQQLGNLTGAIRDLQFAAREYPSNQVAHYRLIQLYKMTNQPELAAREVRIVGELKRGAKPPR